MPLSACRAPSLAMLVPAKAILSQLVNQIGTRSRIRATQSRSLHEKLPMLPSLLFRLPVQPGVSLPITALENSRGNAR